MGRVQSRSGRRTFFCTIAALAWSAGLVVAAFTVPVYGGGQSAGSPNGLSRSLSAGATLVAVNGLWVLVPVAAPAAVTVLVWIALRYKRSRGSGTANLAAWVMVGSLSLFCLVGASTIGLAIVPVGALLAYATARTPLGTA